jgi:ATP-binding cassette subfamily B protein
MSEETQETPESGRPISTRRQRQIRSKRSSIQLSQFIDIGLWAFRLNWAMSPRLTLGTVATTFISSLTPAGLALAARGLVNGLVVLVDEASVNYDVLLPWLALGLGLTILEALSSSLNRFFNQRLYDELENKITMDILVHAAKLDLSFFEDQHGQNTLALIRGGAPRFFLQLAVNLLKIIASIIQVVSLIGILVLIEPVVVLVLLPLAIPYLVLQWRLTRTRYETEYTRTTKRRWLRYFISQMTSEGRVPEIKLLGLAPLLIEQCRKLVAEFRDQNRKLFRRSMLNDFLFVTATSVALYVVLGRVVGKVIAGALTVGDVAIYGGATVRLRRTLEVIVSAVSSVQEGMLYISNLRDFFDIKPQLIDTAGIVPATVDGSIEVSDVSFTYPGSSQPALKGISLRIKPGETIALVGENGAGKTTLAKLLARLYDPTEGSILLDGIDLREISLEHWHRLISFVFQSFGRYEATAAENIAYGDWRHLLNDRERIERVAHMANVHEVIQEMPQGYDTFLGRAFGTYTLSGGQWQRMAVARAFAREDARLLILDEPTSNLDARAEYELFYRFKELAAGRTTILISHRFSTVSMADRILVMDRGQIIERGTHRELMAQGGHYSSLYRLHQRQLDEAG